MKNPEKAYQLIVNNLRPSTDSGDRAAPGLSGSHEAEQGRGIFRIDAGSGTPAVVPAVPLHSRPEHLEPLPAFPDARAASGSPTGAGARGGFPADLHRRAGKPAEVRIRSVGGTMTSVGYAGTSRTVPVKPGGAVTLRDLDR
ncbi:hypothetical protein JK359_22345 [Streptomyces actinomycinicus]|uniref:Uncharacterized protein n=1 Tax=Streptomyces actinomycinicus TaxID=1695166 RepID=A0A937ELX4_9ACTN|nr:hypothetical protein [Streptomyces actinomycinicus]MBL1084675.1 hypothetical protein [Streptomyces actinomycinicus]